MKCGNLISYGPSTQIKIHKRPTKKTEICGGSIDVEIDAWRDDYYLGNDPHVKIFYRCIKCQQTLSRNKMRNFLLILMNFVIFS